MAKITFPVEACHIMMFARAIGDTNPVYHDAEAGEEVRGRRHHRAAHLPAGGGAIRSGLFAAPAPGQKWFGSGKTPSGVEGKPAVRRRRPACRATFRISPPAAARRRADGGDASPGETWERESKRAGKLTFRERITEYRDQNGELVITARGVGVTTERPVDQG